MGETTINEELIDALRAGVLRVDSEGTVVYSNSSAATIMGLREESLVGLKYFEILFNVSDPDEEPRCGPFEFSLTEGEVAHIVSEEIETRTGDQISVEIFCAPLDEGGAVISFDDVTDRREVEVEIADARERALVAAETKSRFLANMSHEIRTPLSGIKGTADLLSSLDLDDEQKELVEILRSSANYLNSIVNDVLDFSKLEAGKYAVRKERFNIRELIQNTVSFHQNSLEATDLSLEYEFEGAEIVLSGERAVRQILNNLVSNAIKFTDSGHVIARGRVSGRSLQIEIEDTGVGVSADQVERLFSPFEQEDEGDLRGLEGTGLGLPISRKLAEELGGSISYHPRNGGGSIFRVELEVESSPPARASFGKTKDLSLDHKRVLVVDDNPTGLRVSSGLLTKMGAVVETASDGLDALEKCENDIFDAVLIDLQMPGMDGFEAGKRILNLENPPKRLVAFTASTSESVASRVAEVGMSGIIFKPFNENDLASAVLGENTYSEVAGNIDLKSDLLQHSIHNFIDDDAIKRLESIEPDKPGAFLREILGVFASHGREKFELLVDAIEKEDEIEAKRLAHNLKGSAANVGMSELVSLFNALEEALKDGAREKLRSLRDRIDEQLNEVFLAISQFVEE